LAIDSAGIIGLLDGKVDSVTVNGDSLFYWKVGVSYGYILPSLNNVWRNTGNTGIDTSVNWLGTNDANDLKIVTNGVRRFTVNTNGALGIGAPADYGTSGYVLKTTGSGGAPAWVAASSIGITTASNGLTATSGDVKLGGTLSQNTTIIGANKSIEFTHNSYTSNSAFKISSTATTITTGKLLEVSQSGVNGTSGVSSYSGYFTNTHTGTTSSNYGLFSSAGGGSTQNTGIYAQTTGGGSSNYGAQFLVSGTGNNYGINIVSASSSATSIGASISAGDYAIIVPESSGNVGIGNVTPNELLSLGTTGGTDGIFSVAGSTSGKITFNPQVAAGTYNWNWPITAGTSGQVLTSAGGGSSAMTWSTPITASSTTTSSTPSARTVSFPLLP
jgi:hypothetical protein